MANSVKFPTSVAASSTGIYTYAWGGAVTRLTADDASYASITASTFDANVISQLVKCQHFDFAIPSRATIDGIVVTVQGYYATSNFTVNHISLLNASGTAEGDDNYTDASQAFSTSASIRDVTFGGAADKWGVSLTPAMVNDDDFGVEFAIKASGNNCDAYLDCLTITVYYTDDDLAVIEREASTDPDTWTEVGTAPWEDAEWTDEGPFTGGVTYCYRVYRYNLGDVGGYSTEDCLEYEGVASTFTPQVVLM